MKRFRLERGRWTASSAPARVSPWKAVLRAFRRDLYVLFLESEHLAHEVVENLPDEGICRVLGVPVGTDVACNRARLAQEIDEKRALVMSFHQENQRLSLAQAVRHIADAWAESDMERGSQQRHTSREHRSNGRYFRSGWKSVPSASKQTPYPGRTDLAREALAVLDTNALAKVTSLKAVRR